MENCNTCYPSTVSCGLDEYVITGLDPDTDYWVILTDRFGNKYRLGTQDENDLTPSDGDGAFVFSMPDGMDDPNAGTYRIEIFTDADLCDRYTLTVCEVEYTCISLLFVKITGHSLDNLICQCDVCPTACMTLTEIPDPMPTYPDECPSGLIKVEVESNNTDYYWWDGVSWRDIVVDSVTAMETYGSLPSGWEVSFDGGAVWIDRGTWSGGYTFPVPVTEVTFKYRSPEGCVYTGRTWTDVLGDMEFIMTFTDFDTLPTGITSWDSLANWNTKLRFNGTAFDTILVDTDTFRVGLAGASGLGLKHLCFQNYLKIIEVEDKVGCVTTVYTSAFLGCTGLAGAYFPASTGFPTAFKDCTGLIDVDVSAAIALSGSFYGCGYIPTVYAPLCATLGNDTFRGCTSLTSVTVSNSLLQIGQRAFYQCTSLPTFTATGVTTISDGAFYQCTSLASVNMPAVVTVELGGFYQCSALTAVSFPACTSVGNDGFRDCAMLDTFDFTSLLTIGSFGFKGTAFNTVTMPVATGMLADVFADCTSLASFTADSVTATNIRVFYNCTALTSISMAACTDLGGSVVDDDVFLNITGNTISATFNTVLATNNGGNPDGDIVYLNANNTVTFTWV